MIKKIKKAVFPVAGLGTGSIAVDSQSPVGFLTVFFDITLTPAFGAEFGSGSFSGQDLGQVRDHNHQEGARTPGRVRRRCPARVSFLARHTPASIASFSLANGPLSVLCSLPLCLPALRLVPRGVAPLVRKDVLAALVDSIAMLGVAQTRPGRRPRPQLPLLLLALLLRLIIVRVGGQVLATVGRALVVGVSVNARGKHEGVVPQGKVVSHMSAELG